MSVTEGIHVETTAVEENLTESEVLQVFGGFFAEVTFMSILPNETAEYVSRNL